MENTLERDMSVNLSFLRYVLIPQLSNQAIFLVDGDNFSKFAEILIEMFGNDGQNIPICCIFFVSIKGSCKKIITAKTMFHWVYYIKAQTACKDAADHVLSACATMINDITPTDCSIYLVSQDGFIREVVAILKMLKQTRKIMYIPPVIDIVRDSLKKLKENQDIDQQIDSNEIDDSFIRIIQLINDTFLINGKCTVLLSNLGILLREHHLLEDKKGMKIITHRLYKTELGHVVGSEGNSCMIFHHAQIKKFLKLT